MTINDAVMGSPLPAVATGKTVPIRIVIRDKDDPGGTHRVRLYYDAAVGGPNAQVIETKTVQDGDTLKFDPKPTQGRGYYFIEVTDLADCPIGSPTTEQAYAVLRAQVAEQPAEDEHDRCCLSCNRPSSLRQCMDCREGRAEGYRPRYQSMV